MNYCSSYNNSFEETEVVPLAQGYTGHRVINWYLNPGRLVPEPVLSATGRYHLSETVTVELRNPS